MTSVRAPYFKAAVYRVGPRTLASLERGEAIVSAIDPMTNQMCLDGSDIRAMLFFGHQRGADSPKTYRSPYGGGADDEHRDVHLSDSVLRALLHELTHHASFAGDVGNARAALATSVCGRASMLIKPTKRGELLIPQRDDLVLRFHEVVYEPLIEGLAVFAEHDIRWGSSSLASHTLLHIWSFALHAKAATAALNALDVNSEGNVADRLRESYSDWISSFLLAARTRDYWIEQKVRLLQQPLLGAQGGAAYLLGYLAVKRAYLVLRHANRGYADSDIYLLLMLKYWFSDAAMANKLVRLDDLHVISIQQTLADISEIFQDKWDNLYLHPAEVGRGLLLGIEDNCIKEIDPMSEFGLGLGVRTAGESLHALVPKFYKHRLVLRLGMLRVNIRSSKETRLAEVWNLHSSELLIECPISELADTGDFPGSIEVVRTYDGRITAIAVLGGSGLVAIRELFGGEWNAPSLVELFDDLPSFELVEASVESYQQSPFAKRWEAPDYRDVDRTAMESANKLCTSAYLQLAFRGLTRDRLDVVVETLGKEGFKALFPEKSDLKELALMSMYFGGPGASIRSVADALGRSHNAVHLQLRTFNERVRSVLGVNVFEIVEDVATSAV